jgi:hypothetical protein
MQAKPAGKPRQAKLPHAQPGAEGRPVRVGKRPIIVAV